MKNGKIVQLRTVWADDDGHIQGGINFFLPEDSRIVMIQRWEYMAAGNVYSQVEPDVIGEQGLLEYWIHSFKHDHENDREYRIDDVDGDYR